MYRKRTTVKRSVCASFFHLVFSFFVSTDESDKAAHEQFTNFRVRHEAIKFVRDSRSLVIRKKNFRSFAFVLDWGCKKLKGLLENVRFLCNWTLSDRRNNLKPVKNHAFPFIYGSMMLSFLLCGKLNAGQRYSNHIFHNATNSQTAIVHCSCFMLFRVVQHSELISWESLS